MIKKTWCVVNFLPLIGYHEIHNWQKEEMKLKASDLNLNVELNRLLGHDFEMDWQDYFVFWRF